MNTSRVVLLHRRLSHLTVLVALVTLTLSEASLFQPGVGPGVYLGPLAYLALTLGAGLASWVLAERPGRVRLSPKLSLLCLPMVIGFVVLETLLTGGSDWVVGLAHFLILVQLIKLFGTKARRDYAQMYLVSLVHVCVAAFVTADMVFVVGLVVYSALMIWTLLLFHYRRHLDPSGAWAGGSQPVQADLGTVLSARFVTALLSLLMLAWVGTGLFFVFSPRFRTPLYGLAQNRFTNVVLSGFSSDIRLGEMGRILQDVSPVMHVRLTVGDEAYHVGDERSLQWRGATLQHYDGRKWTERDEDLNIRLNARLGGLPVNIPHEPAAQDVVLEQEILLQPTGQTALFGLPNVIQVRCERLSYVEHRAVDHTFRTRRPVGQPLRYQVASLFEGPSVRAETLTGFAMSVSLEPGEPHYDPAVRRAYLQLPQDLSPRIAELTRSLTTHPDMATDLAKSRAVAEYVQTEFSYTLEQETDPNVEPVEHFLFTRKAGHCEYFASAMTLMLRTMGIPARVVTGFKGAQWNDLGGWYVVRQADAHAWVEVWIRGRGWVSFDPTPASARELSRSGRQFGFVERWKDYLYSFWMLNVYQYDREQQTRVYERTTDVSRWLHRVAASVSVWTALAVRKLRTRLLDPSLLTSAQGVLVLAGTLLMSSILGVVLFLLGRGILRRLLMRLRRRRRNAWTSSTSFYNDMLKTLRRHGLSRAPETTPVEFANQAGRVLGPRAIGPLDAITRVFCRLRYGRRALSDVDRRLLADSLEELQGVTRSRADRR